MLSVIFLMALFLSPCQAQTNARVNLVSRLEFAPNLLDLIRKSLAQKLNTPCTLFFQPLEDFYQQSIDRNCSRILIEKGIDTQKIPKSFVKSNKQIELAWVMAVRGDALPLVKEKEVDLQRFFAILAELKKASPNRFPWFEPLCSKISLKNFCQLLDKETATSTATISQNRSLWQETSAIAVLYRSIESEYLNPLSVEADMALADNVFEAKDADFSTCWVPVDHLTSQEQHQNESAPVMFIPFPAASGAGIIPRIRLDLWEQGTLSGGSHETAGNNASSTLNFIDLDFAADMAWIEKHFSNRYDALIMGDL